MPLARLREHGTGTSSLKLRSERTSVVDRLVIAFVAGLFGFSALDKLAHLHGFISALDNFRILPIPMGFVLAPVIIAAEATIAIGLVKHSWRRLAALCAAALMSLFTTALIANRALGGRGTCGCWFSINMAEGNLHLLLNALIIGLSLLVWRASIPKQAGAGAPGRHAG